MLNKRQERRLNTLMRGLIHIDKNSADSFFNWRSQKEKEKYYEIYFLADLKGLTENQLRTEWKKVRRAQLHRSKSYNIKPIEVRQDNKTTQVGSGGSNQTKIRFPRAVRKTAWKRFWKLFPGLDGCCNWEDYHKKCNANPDMVYPLYQAPYKKTV